MKIPYGISDFSQLGSEGIFYADKTPFIPVLESAESGYRYLLFLRPRLPGVQSDRRKAPPRPDAITVEG